MMIPFFIFLAIIGVGIYVWSKNRSLPSNRYRKTKRATPSLFSKKQVCEKEETDVETEINEDAFDEDGFDALGIRSKEVTLTTKATASSSSVVGNQSDCLIVLYLMAPKGCVYGGYELLQALLSAGMRYGKQRIFNRHEHKDGRGEILFHCASAIAPGTFDLTKMGAFSCQGLCLFFNASSVEDPMSTFDCLLETIDQLIEDIGGQVLDEKHALFTKDRMVKYRQQIRIIETGKTTADLFA